MVPREGMGRPGAGMWLYLGDPSPSPHAAPLCPPVPCQQEKGAGMASPASAPPPRI